MGRFVALIVLALGLVSGLVFCAVVWWPSALAYCCVVLTYAGLTFDFDALRERGHE